MTARRGASKEAGPAQSLPLAGTTGQALTKTSGTDLDVQWKTLAASDVGAAPLVEGVNTVATSGAAQTIPAVTASTISKITLTANCTLTFPTAAAGKSFTLVLVQDGTGSRLVTWPASIMKWPGAVAPVLSTGAGKIDYLTCTCVDGTNWAGFFAGKDVR